MSTQSLEAQLLKCREHQVALGLAMEALTVANKENNANMMAIIAKLAVGGMCDVQPGKLDIALTPTHVLNNTPIENDSCDCQEVASLELLAQMGSQTTLLGEDSFMEEDELEIANPAEKDGENLSQEFSAEDERFLYSLYTDPLVIAAEFPWRATQELSVGCSDAAVELSDIASCDESHRDELSATAVTEAGVEEAGLDTEEKFVYSL
ncbi:hypothetical protein HDU81_004491 [Chytriomyces hyalinus]|nr:hypothetical protein HDU81_004491 [Chytriomyces hyalinus]